MRRTNIYPYLILGACLFCWLSIPQGSFDSVRSSAIALFLPSFDREDNPKELLRLQLENQHLKTQIEIAYERLHFDQLMTDQLEHLKELSKEDGAYFERRKAQLRSRLKNQMVSFPAQVIYRDPSSWSSSLWVNAGEEDNEAFGHAIIAKNSPVVNGASLIGVVDFVGRKQSRVRLITDSGLSPAVRAVRGGSQNRELTQLLQSLLNRLETRKDLETYVATLRELASKVGPSWEDGYLAKGELHGSSTPFWRSRGQILKGIGFNFDYPDEEGPARDLRTGRPIGTSSGAIPILKEGDLLITSGLDGVFPQGLLVATVTSTGPLKEGAYAYEIEAKPIASHLNDLQTLFILPSLSSE